ncbi:MAG: hypothetical protein IPK26_26320 [Planctomycetes bacterium]|nr:hypothetical protein [Planctomycetota bacterium]
MISADYSFDMARCVAQIRSMSGQDDIDIVWNKHTNRWVVVQRVKEAKFPLDALVVGCLPNPDNPPPMTDMRALFAVRDKDGKYLNPIGREQEMAELLVVSSFRSAEAWRLIKESRDAAARHKAKEDAEWRAEMNAAAEHEFGRVFGTAQHSVSFP